jgi:hypothetical protein
MNATFGIENAARQGGDLSDGPAPRHGPDSAPKGHGSSAQGNALGLANAQMFHPNGVASPPPRRGTGRQGRRPFWGQPFGRLLPRALPWAGERQPVGLGNPNTLIPPRRGVGHWPRATPWVWPTPKCSTPTGWRPHRPEGAPFVRDGALSGGNPLDGPLPRALPWAGERQPFWLRNPNTLIPPRRGVGHWPRATPWVWPTPKRSTPTGWRPHRPGGGTGRQGRHPYRVQPFGRPTPPQGVALGWRTSARWAEKHEG